MLKRLVNEARFQLIIETTGPVLVKSGHAALRGPNMAPVRTYRNGTWEVYLPGSSLKGVIRSHVEKVARTLNPAPGAICNPFRRVEGAEVRGQGNRLVYLQYPDVFCGAKFETRKNDQRSTGGVRWVREAAGLDTSTAYADSCPVCRLFGSTAFIGRVSIGDAYLVPGSPGRTERRDGVGIDRLTGGAAHGAKFDLETVASGARFQAEVTLRNFECWQLGALLLVVQDLQDGFIRVGSGRSRGLGAVRAWISEASAADASEEPSPGLEIHYPGLLAGPAPEAIVGLGAFLADGSYGTDPEDRLTPVAASRTQRRGVRLVTTYTGAALAAVTNAAVAAFARRIQAWQVPTQMTWEALDWRPAGKPS